MWKMGNRPAQATANSVIASAKRLIEVRHCWRSSSRIAEISVPAWPMPIHQTKLMIAKPHAIGTFTPQMPTPRNRSQASESSSTFMTVNAMPKPTNQPSGVFFERTRLAILSVTVANVWPGPMIGASTRTGGSTREPLAMVSLAAGSLARDLGVRVAHRREVGRARLRLQLLEQSVAARAGVQLRDPALLVVQVAEHDRLRRAGLLAGGHDLAVPDRAVLVLGVDARAHDPLH